MDQGEGAYSVIQVFRTFLVSLRKIELQPGGFLEPYKDRKGLADLFSLAALAHKLCSSMQGS